MRPALTFIRTLLGYPSGLVGLILLLIMIAMAVSAPYLYPEGPWEMAGSPFIWPGTNPDFPLGTDALGRDIAAGVFYGTGVSLAIGLAATVAALVVGITVGALAGYYRGWTDVVLMRLTDAVQTVPGFLFTIVIVAIFSPSIKSITAAVALVSWPTVARLTRAEVLRLRNIEFVQSCRVVGMSDTRIILRQILPNGLAPVVVASSVLVASAIIIEAGLAFLGLGDPNVMSLGTMIGTGRSALRTAWYVALVPGAFVIISVLGLNMLGDALNDALNPRLRR